MARALAERMREDDPIASAYQIVLQREPTPRERLAATKLIDAYGAPAFCRALLNANELNYLE